MFHTITLSTPLRRSFRAEQIAGLFDVPIAERLTHTLTAELPDDDEEWTIGAIVGPSGSGKTTLARSAFGSALHVQQPWPRDQAIIDCLGHRPIKELTRVLGAVGLGSPPAWLKSYHVLSRGEQFRADLAKALLDCPTLLLVIDEFTSHLDRTVAKTASAALAKHLRSQNSFRFIALTCHDDILPWLEPDWVLDLGQFSDASQKRAWFGDASQKRATHYLTRGRLRRPTITLRVARVPQNIWPHFARHHYLSGGLSSAASCYAALWHDQPAAFCAVVASLGWRGRKRITRLVTLPEFQGLGIGVRLAEAVARHERAKNNRISITASHPAIVAHCSRSPAWQYRGLKKTGSTRQHFGDRQVRCSRGRTVASFEFVGP